MFSTIVVPENAAGSFFDLARELLLVSDDKRQVSLTPDIYAEHNPDGLAIKFSCRVLRPPQLFRDTSILRVVIDHTNFDGSRLELVDKKVVCRRAWATMSSGGGKCTHLKVWGSTLGSANNLYQDILDGIAEWR